MKIALVSPYDYPYPGGVTAHISHLHQEFSKLGHEVIIIAPSSAGESDLLRGNVRKVGNVVPIPANGSVARITLSLRQSGRIKRILRAERFDLIHLHEPLVPGVPTTVLHHSRTTNVGTFHAYWGLNISLFYSNPLLRRFNRKLHGRIAVSPAALRFVTGSFPGEYEIIPNGIDATLFSAEVQPLEGLRDGKLNILFVGRLEKRKGFKYMLRAFHLVKQRWPASRLLVAGAYSEKAQARYEQIVAKAQLPDVHFLGFLSNEDLVRCYKTADVCCAPSTGGESFGIVLLEAMAAGKPIVASDIEGYRAVLANGVEGLLVPPKKEKLLAEALLRLLNDSELRRAMGAAGQAKAESYSWASIAARLLEYYGEVIAKRAAATKTKALNRKRKKTRRAVKRRWLNTRRWAGKWMTLGKWKRRLLRV